MRNAGRIAAEVLRICKEAVVPGVTTAYIDEVCAKAIASFGAKSSDLGYFGFPANLCVSVNEEVIHGIPGPRVINLGDVVSLDVTINYEGYHGDNAVTIPVGNITPEAEHLLKVTEDALYAGIAAAVPGGRVSDISNAVEKVGRAGKCGIVREFVGHGIGRSMHEEPQIPNFGKPGKGLLLEEGMVICIEPMFTQKTPRIDILEDQWTVVTHDRLPAAHFEHTIAIRHGGAEILTKASC